MCKKPKKFYKDLGIKKCIVCGKEFKRKCGEHAYHFRKKVCCSRECAYKLQMNGLKVIECEKCGKKFMPLSFTQRFCGSRKYKWGCSYEHLKEMKRRVKHDYKMRGSRSFWTNYTKIVR